MDTLQPFLLLQLDFLRINSDATEVRHPIGLESRFSTLGIETSLLFLLLLRLELVSFVEREGSLALLSDGDRILFDLHSSLLVLVADLLITWDKNSGWDGLVTELVLDHVLLFHLFLLNHLVDLLLSSAGFLSLLVTQVKAERLRHGHAVAAFAQRFLTNLVHVVIRSNPLLIQVAATEAPRTLMSLHPATLVAGFIGLLSLQVIL